MIITFIIKSDIEPKYCYKNYNENTDISSKFCVFYIANFYRGKTQKHQYNEENPEKHNNINSTMIMSEFH